MIALGVCAQGADLATGVVLVATAKSKDPDFTRSVVLLIQYDSESAVGLMLNKPTTIPIADVLPGARPGAVVYAGGPIAIGVRGLVRSKSSPFFSVVTGKNELAMQRDGPERFRVYAGYTGWTARQLQSEVARGFWKALPARAVTVFDPHPATLWPRLTSPN